LKREIEEREILMNALNAENVALKKETEYLKKREEVLQLEQ
jgi:hypothetical protein